MKQYLTFSIAGESCAFGVEDVESVVEAGDLSRVSGSPEYVAGLLNLRGDPIPVIDVRTKLGLDAAEAQARDRCVIVLSLGDGRTRHVGALVDSVSEVIEIPDERISPIGDMAVPFDKGIVRGVAKWEARFITLFQTAGLFSDARPVEAKA